MNSVKFLSVFRVLAGLLFLALGLYHFYEVKMLAIFVPLPLGSEVFVCVVGAVITTGALGLVSGKYIRISWLLIGVTLFVSGFFIQLPIMFRERDELLRMVGISNILKLGIACIILLILAIRNAKR